MQNQLNKYSFNKTYNLSDNNSFSPINFMQTFLNVHPIFKEGQQDAIEFMLAGATGVAVGMMNFVNPYATEEVVKGIEDYMIRHNIDDINTIIGAVHQPLELSK